MDKNEFDSDFDFEKEYGFSLETIMGSDEEEEEEDELLDEEEDTASDDEFDEDEEADDMQSTDAGDSDLGEGDNAGFDPVAFAGMSLDSDAEADDDFDLDALTRELGGEPVDGEDAEEERTNKPVRSSAPASDEDEEDDEEEEGGLFAFFAKLFGRGSRKERRVRPQIDYDGEEIPLNDAEELSLDAELDFAREDAVEIQMDIASEFQDEALPEINGEVPTDAPEASLFSDEAEGPAEVFEETAVPDEGAFETEAEPFIPAESEPEEAPAVPVENSGETVIYTDTTLPRRPRRRRKPSKMRIFKDVYLPPIIAGVTVILLLTFITGSISRAIQRNRTQAENKENAANASMNEAAQLQEESQKLLKEAAKLAAVYDYEGAIAMLDTFSGDMSGFTEMVSKRQDYAIANDAMVEWTDPTKIPNLSFHLLIADPARAFSDAENGAAYNMNFVTTDEFSAILEQLYRNNYVLVDFDCFVEATTGEDGRTTYAAKPLYLPEGKKPIMLTETLVNYFGYMIDGNDDGTPDAQGAGFASRLVLDADGKVTAEMVDGSGNTVTGEYDLVPILNRFIEEHEGFSYRGSKATLAVCGYEGIFGYRVQKSVLSSRGQEYYDAQVTGAKAVLQALRDDGYNIACYTYNNISYGDFSATDIQADLLKWNDEIAPITGDLDLLVYARSADISDTGTPYSGSKFNVLYSTGFRYFVGSSEQGPFAEIAKDHVRQTRLQVTGLLMSTKPAVYSSYFDAASVLNSQRGAQ